MQTLSAESLLPIIYSIANDIIPLSQMFFNTTTNSAPLSPLKLLNPVKLHIFTNHNVAQSAHATTTTNVNATHCSHKTTNILKKTEIKGKTMSQEGKESKSTLEAIVRTKIVKGNYSMLGSPEFENAVLEGKHIVDTAKHTIKSYNDLRAFSQSSIASYSY